MYAIVKIGGHQYKVEKDDKIYVNRLENQEGDTVEFDNVMLTDDDGNVKVGAPVVEGAKISAKVLEHTRADKVIIFKKKRRKGYQKRTGHRQDITHLVIEDIQI
jgi:large subunit ribosomal protein L21